MAKIMIVEDETTIRELISEELQNGNLKRLEQPILMMYWMIFKRRILN